jgi:hypothetical protein
MTRKLFPIQKRGRSRLEAPLSVLLLSMLLVAPVLLPAASARAQAAPNGPETPFFETPRRVEAPLCSVEAPEVSTPVPAAVGGEAPPAAGWRIYLDRQTGEITQAPTPRQLAAFAAAAPEDASLARSDAGLVMEIRADGTKAVNLQGRFQSTATVHRTAGGALALACGHAPASPEGSTEGSPVGSHNGAPTPARAGGER